MTLKEWLTNPCPLIVNFSRNRNRRENSSNYGTEKSTYIWRLGKSARFTSVWLWTNHLTTLGLSLFICKEKTSFLGSNVSPILAYCHCFLQKICQEKRHCARKWLYFKGAYRWILKVRSPGHILFVLKFWFNSQQVATYELYSSIIICY